MKSSHEFAKELLALPDLPICVNYDGEYNAQPREPSVQLLDGDEYVVFDAHGKNLPSFPVIETE